MIKLARHICIVLALFTGNAVLAANSGWTISEADGQVSIIRDDKALYGAQGTTLQVGDVIRTGKGARAVLVRGDDFVVVSPEAQVRISKTKERGAVAEMFQSLGTMLSNIGQKTGAKQKANQPILATVVKGYDRGEDEQNAEMRAKAMNTINEDQ